MGGVIKTGEKYEYLSKCVESANYIKGSSQMETILINMILQVMQLALSWQWTW